MLKRILLALSLMVLPMYSLGQTPKVTTLQVQNAGTPVFTRNGFIPINFTGPGCTASNSSGVLTINCVTGGGSGTVTSVSVTTANGVSGSVATATSTPAISLTLGAITPTSTNGVLAATMAFLDATSSVQTQLNAKSPIAGPTFTGTVTIPNGGVFGTPTSINLTNATGFPATIVQTNQANTYSTGLQGFSAADLLLPVHSSDPGTCTAGQLEFNSTSTLLKFCSATNTWTASGSGGSGTINAAAQFAAPYYSAAGSATTISGVAAPTTPNGVPQTYTSTPSGSAAVAPVFSLPGIPGRAVTGTTSTDTILAADCFPNRVEYVGSVAVAITLPTATTLAVPKCVFKVVNNTTGSTTALTITPTTWTIGPAASATLTVAQGQSVFIYQDPNSATNWAADVNEPAISAGANITLTRSQSGLSIASSAGAATNINLWTSQANAGSATGMGTAGHTLCQAQYLPNPGVFTHIGINVAVADGAHNYEFGVYTGNASSTITLVGNTTPAVISGTGQQAIALASSLTLPAGRIYLCFGAATVSTATISEGTGTNVLLTEQDVSTSFFPATFTSPADSASSAQVNHNAGAFKAVILDLLP